MRPKSVRFPAPFRPKPTKPAGFSRPTRRGGAGRINCGCFTLLEDPSGNQVGRAFEMQPGAAADPRPRPETVAIPFVVADPR